VGLPEDLLEQAGHLARRERKRPRQASLRRAVSAAYYALFHLLTSEAANLIGPAAPAGLRQQVRRAFAHREMKHVCKQFGSGSVQSLNAGTRKLVTAPLAPELVSVATAFADLQEARHQADYDVSEVLTRVDVLQKIALARQAFAAWQAIKGTPNAAVFLAALLLQRHWSQG